MAKSMLEKLKQEREKMNNKGGKIDFAKINFKPDMGENLVRILPAKGDAEFFYTKFGQHWINKKPALCPKYTHGGECPICEMVSNLYEGNEDDKALAKQIKASKRAAMNVVKRTAEGDGAKVYEVSQTFLSKIIDYFLDDDYGDLTDPEEGFDFKVIKDIGENGQINYDKSRPKPKPTAVDPEDMEQWLENAKDLQEWCVDSKVKTYEELGVWLKAQLGIDDNAAGDEEEDPVEEPKASSVDEESLLDKINSRIKEND